MLPKHDVLQQLIDEKIVAVIRGGTAEEAVQVAKSAIRGGIRAIELTYTTPEVGQVLNQLADEEVIVGAGTVLDSETARHAILHGAKFIVSPNFQKSIAALCNRYAVPYLPGCMTISEMVKAMESGCDIIKLFPANQFEPSFISSVQGPLPYVRIMPTGGISLKNINEWLDAGAVAVGIGSDLTKAYRAGGELAVKQLAAEYVTIIKKEDN
ncbi:bifunctional 2-keto-4-hydroxyglutarate aldolase/2-keto-3-deoxy-6-phosphogluconate aldolase [Lysinibacillus sp. NPDC097287]|uniref:bifunctional 2-keto-4-hydroxyglutarate aldolase/2-keto-3-deoxy-6-phosphogluconate aldolase n=1 Tax=Lysinibacillus sp. NPDC097287 TaxID=3364144 RepID=UPI0037FDE060